MAASRGRSTNTESQLKKSWTVAPAKALQEVNPIPSQISQQATGHHLGRSSLVSPARCHLSECIEVYSLTFVLTAIPKVSGMKIPIQQMRKLKAREHAGIEDHCRSTGSRTLVSHCPAEPFPPDQTVHSLLCLGKRELDVFWLQILVHGALFEKTSSRPVSNHAYGRQSSFWKGRGQYEGYHQSLLHN